MRGGQHIGAHQLVRLGRGCGDGCRSTVEMPQGRRKQAFGAAQVQQPTAAAATLLMLTCGRQVGTAQLQKLIKGVDSHTRRLGRLRG